MKKLLDILDSLSPSKKRVTEDAVGYEWEKRGVVIDVYNDGNVFVLAPCENGKKLGHGEVEATDIEWLINFVYYGWSNLNPSFKKLEETNHNSDKIKEKLQSIINEWEETISAFRAYAEEAQFASAGLGIWRYNKKLELDRKMRHYDGCIRQIERCCKDINNLIKEK